jgi:hypothetical protein
MMATRNEDHDQALATNVYIPHHHQFTANYYIIKRVAWNRVACYHPDLRATASTLPKFHYFDSESLLAPAILPPIPKAVYRSTAKYASTHRPTIPDIYTSLPSRHFSSSFLSFSYFYVSPNPTPNNLSFN